MSQQELAEKIGSTQPAVALWESAAYQRHNLSTLGRIAEALGYDLAVVFKERNVSSGKK